MTTRSRFDIIVHTFVFDQDRLLLLRRANTGFLDGYYSLPGGHVEAGEEVAGAAVREVAEEARIEILEIEPSIVMPYGDGVDFLFEARRCAAPPGSVNRTVATTSSGSHRIDCR